MASVTFTINDAHVTAFLTNFCAAFGYDGPANNSARTAFYKATIISYSKANAAQGAAAAAIAAAQTQAATDAAAIDIT